MIKLPDLKQKAGQFRFVPLLHVDYEYWLIFSVCISLRDGRSIHTVTALLLQLVQTSSHDTALQARDFSRKRRELAVQYGGPASKQALDRMMADIDMEVSPRSAVNHSSVVLESDAVSPLGDESLRVSTRRSLWYRTHNIRILDLSVCSFICVKMYQVLLNWMPG